MIICLKRISEECFLFNVNVTTSLKFLWTLEGLSEGNQGLEYSESIWALKHLVSRRAPEEHLEGIEGHSGT